MGTVKLFIEPTLILHPSKVEEDVLEKIDADRKNEGDGDSKLTV